MTQQEPCSPPSPSLDKSTTNHPIHNTHTTTALQPSRRLIQRLRRRDLFTSVGTVPLTPHLERRTLASSSSAAAASSLSMMAAVITDGGHELVERVSGFPQRFIHVCVRINLLKADVRVDGHDRRWKGRTDVCS